MSTPSSAKHEYSGIPVSPGVVKGKVLLYDIEVRHVPRRQIGSADVEPEKQRLAQAIQSTRKKLLGVIQEAKESESESVASILNAHLQILDDPVLYKSAAERIETEQTNAEYALHAYIEDFSAHLRKPPQKIGERHLEILQDIAKRVLHALLGWGDQSASEFEGTGHCSGPRPVPFGYRHMDREKVIAFATEIGGPTSHTAIMARSLEIPAVVGVVGLTDLVKDGDEIVIDGTSGRIIINPDEEEIVKYRRARLRFEALEQKLDSLRDLEAETRDGYRVELSANIELPRRGGVRAAARRPGHRPLSHRISLSQPVRSARRRGSIGGLSIRGGANRPRDSHPAHGRSGRG